MIKDYEYKIMRMVLSRSQFTKILDDLQYVNMFNRFKIKIII